MEVDFEFQKCTQRIKLFEYVEFRGTGEPAAGVFHDQVLCSCTTTC